MSEFKARLHLTEMLEAVREIEADTAGIDKAAWLQAGYLMRSVSMSLITLGEGAAQLPDVVKAQADTVPWSRMIGLRNRLAHAYFRADPEIVWEAATLHTPVIKAELERLLAEWSKA